MGRDGMGMSHVDKRTLRNPPPSPARYTAQPPAIARRAIATIVLVSMRRRQRGRDSFRTVWDGMGCQVH